MNQGVYKRQINDADKCQPVILSIVDNSGTFKENKQSLERLNAIFVY